MRWSEPCAFPIELETGLMLGTGSRYQKRFCDLSVSSGCKLTQASD
jgi:hypothetical protein